jgi:hypothetical protein
MNVSADRIVELNLAIHNSKEMNKRSLQALVLVVTSLLPQPKSSKKKGYSRVLASLSQQKGCSKVFLSSLCRGGLRGSFLTCRRPKKEFKGPYFPASSQDEVFQGPYFPFR